MFLGGGVPGEGGESVEDVPAGGILRGRESDHKGSRVFHKLN